MKRNKSTTSALFVLALIILFVLAACAQSVTVADPDISDEIEDYLTDISESVAETSNNTLLFTIPEENRMALRRRMFIGDGELSADVGGGDELEWYFFVFGPSINGISGHFINIVGTGAFTPWTTGSRNWREPTLITFIEDFNITMEDMIIAQETAFGRPREEIEELINWGRNGTSSSVTSPGNEFFWAIRFTLSDLEALFSGDVNQLWAAFPGYGVVQNNRAYSPEWILNNIVRAVLEEQIPMEEILRILEMAEQFPQLSEVVAQARALLEAGITGITLRPGEAILSVGETLAITAVVLPDTDSVATWVSSNPGVATVDSNGVVTAVSVGATTITATTTAGEQATSEILVIGEGMSIGDVNGDGVVDFLDLLVLIYYLDNNGNISSDVTFVRENADLNGDGVIDDLDLELLMTFLDVLGAQ